MPATNVKVPVTSIFRSAREFFNLLATILEKMTLKNLILLVTNFDKMPVKSAREKIPKEVSRTLLGVTAKKKSALVYPFFLQIFEQ